MGFGQTVFVDHPGHPGAARHRYADPLALALAGRPEGRGMVVRVGAIWVLALALALPFAGVVTWMLD